MRIFTKFPEAFGEIARELNEMGTNVTTASMQDKQGEFETLELMNYVYTVTDPKFEDLTPVQPWADAEWAERRAGIEGNPVNPGRAYRRRTDLDWSDYLEIDDVPFSTHPSRIAHMDVEAMHAHTSKVAFSYAYSERFSRFQQVRNVIARLKTDPASRQLVVGMWSMNDSTRLGQRRVPCSLMWHFLYRGGALHMTYFMRSCDFAAHFQNDVFLSLRLQEYVAEQTGLKRGHFAQFMSSLHVYRKDVRGVF